jgi:hypothetical protein
VIAGTNLLCSLRIEPATVCSIVGQVKKFAAAPLDFCVGFTHATPISNFHSVIARRYCRISGAVAADGLAFGAAAKIPYAGAPSASVLLEFPVAAFRAQAVARLDRGALKVRVSNHRFGVYAAVSRAAVPYLEVAWRTRINKFNVHSSLDTEGVVKSFLGKRVNSKCTVGFYAELANAKSTYRSGLSLNFHESDRTIENAA